MQGFHAGWRKSGIGGADGKHGLYEFCRRTWSTCSAREAVRQGSVPVNLR